MHPSMGRITGKGSSSLLEELEKATCRIGTSSMIG
jgi:hypothetical protein